MAYRRTARPVTTIYVDGNTVRRVQTWEEIRRREEYARTREEQRKKTLRSHAVRRNQERASFMNLRYVFVLAAAGVMTLFLCLQYLQVQSSITSRLAHIEEQELQLEHLRAENNALQTRIDTYIDLDYVSRVATQELGMVYAKPNQILLYEKTESEYVRQNEDVPEH